MNHNELTQWSSFSKGNHTLKENLWPKKRKKLLKQPTRRRGMLIYCFFLFNPFCFVIAFLQSTAHKKFLPIFSWLLTSLWVLVLPVSWTFRAHFGLHNSLCILKAKASRGTKLCIYFNFYSLYNKWKDRLSRTSGSQFYEWLFGPEKFSGRSRHGPLVLPVEKDKWTWETYWRN